MKKRLLKLVSIAFLAFLPVAAGAQITVSGLSAGDECAALVSGIGKLLCNIQNILNSIVPVLIALGVVYFVWGVVQFVISDEEEAKTKGKDRMIYGIIGFAVIIGVWGFVAIIVNTFGFAPGELNAPSLVLIQEAAPDGTCVMGTKFQGVLKYFTCIINNSVIPFIFAVAIVMFIWGGVKFFIINADEEAKREEGKQFMIWGIIALTVMTVVWGLVGILGSTFGLNGKVLPQVCPPGSTQC